MVLQGDEGKTLFAVRLEDKEHLIIAFPKPIAWIGLHKQDVENLMQVLQNKVKEMI